MRQDLHPHGRGPDRPKNSIVDPQISCLGDNAIDGIGNVVGPEDTKGAFESDVSVTWEFFRFSQRFTGHLTAHIAVDIGRISNTTKGCNDQYRIGVAQHGGISFEEIPGFVFAGHTFHVLAKVLYFTWIIDDMDRTFTDASHAGCSRSGGKE
jgi:hypothetical protein